MVKEKSKTKFLAKFGKVSTELELALNQLLLISDAISSLNDEDSEEEGDDEEEDDEEVDEADTCSIFTNTTTNINLDNSAVELRASHESLKSEMSYVSAADTYHRSVSQVSHTTGSSGGGDAVADVTVTANENGTVVADEHVNMEDLFPVLTDVVVKSFPWEQDTPYPVIIVSTNTPMDFFIQIVNPNNDVMEQLCMFFMEEASTGYTGGINYIPTPNSFCCALSTKDGVWYRAKVSAVQNQPKDAAGNLKKKEVVIKVFFIDEGYYGVVNLYQIRPLLQRFAKLPAQSMKCILGGVQPINAVSTTKNLSFNDCNNLWQQESISFFEGLVQKGNICSAYFYDPPRVSLQPPHNVSQDTLVCDLYIVEKGCKVGFWTPSDDRVSIENHIAFKLVTIKLAAPCPFFSSELNYKDSLKILERYMQPSADQSGNVINHVSSVNVDCNLNLDDIKKEKDVSVVSQRSIPYDERPPIKTESRLSSTSSNSTLSIKKETKKADDKLISKKNENFFPAKKSPEPQKTVFIFGTSYKEIVLEADGDSGFAKVLVSEVVNPNLIYVHLINEEVVLLDDMISELNDYYNAKSKEIQDFFKSCKFTYKVDDPIAVFYFSDEMWYRALIRSLRSGVDNKIEYEVLYVDFGSSEWIYEENILPIVQRFCELPMEVIACSLADLKPCSNVVTKQVNGKSVCSISSNDEVDGDLTWSSKATYRLRDLIVTQLPMMVSLKTTYKNVDGFYEVYLFDTADNKDVFINQVLVDEGLATSDVLTKVTPSVIVREDELEEAIVEENALTNWNPMEDDFYSNRNVYSVDTDDPGVASIGVVQARKQPCNNFLYRGHCYRGTSCKFVHALPGDPIYDSVEVFCNDNILDLPKAENHIPVVIKALLDPTHFWVNFPFGLDWNNDIIVDSDNDQTHCGLESLEKLNSEMNEYYRKLGRLRKTNLSLYAEGELIAAKFSVDNQWYRARVVNTAEDLVQVFYVDYGNTDIVTEDRTNALLPEFLHLPFQAVECFLFNTYLEDDLTPQDDKVVDMRIKFRDMVADRVLMAYIVNSSITKSLVVKLYDTAEQTHLYINELVRSWDGIKDSNISDIELLKQRYSNEKSSTVSYIPG